MKVKNPFLGFRISLLDMDLNYVYIWEDIWLGNTPLSSQYPELRNIFLGFL
jgi:hypothetical protein